MKVKTLRPEWDEEEVLKEVARIRDDKQVANPIPAGDPFNTGGGQDLQGDPAVDGGDGVLEDPADGEPVDGADPKQGQAKAA
jgi:hypothetical protein